MLKRSDQNSKLALRSHLYPTVKVCFNTSNCLVYHKTNADLLVDWDIYNVTSSIGTWREFIKLYHNTSTDQSTIRGVEGTNQVTIHIILDNVDSYYSAIETNLLLYNINVDHGALREKLMNPAPAVSPGSSTRLRRSTGENEGCSLQQWYVSFDAIGWNMWVVEPRGIQANYCTGSCEYTLQSEIFLHHVYGTNHAFLKHSFRRIFRSSRDRLPPASCVPSELSATTFILRGLNSTTTVAKKMNHLIADHCMCA